MRSLVKILLLIVIVLIFTDKVTAQKKDPRIREKAVREEVDQYLQNNYEGKYMVGHILDIDAVKGSLIYFFETVQNPYGILNNTFVFLTSIPDKHLNEVENNLLGIYKEGQIKILSDGELPIDGGSIVAIDDLTNGENVEFVTKVGSPLMEVWIHSWDGISSKAKRLNEIDYNSSTIQMREHTFDIFDADGDGIQEIRSLDSEDGELTWSWNGDKYGMWPNTPHVSINKLYPANNFIPHVFCNVEVESGKYNYRYTVENDKESKQRIDLFWVEAKTDSLLKRTPNNWKGHLYAFDLEGWNTRVLNDGNLIWPGNSLSGFVFITNGLPAVASFRMQAKNSPPFSDEFDLYLLDRAENMVLGKTIGPKDPPNPFVPNEFIDSLINYIDQSDSLGWIKDQTTFDKYGSYLTTAKTALEQNQINQARIALQSIIQEVDIDSTSNITSEAYALLRYNTEYLLENLPEDPDTTK